MGGDIPESELIGSGESLTSEVAFYDILLAQDIKIRVRPTQLTFSRMNITVKS